MFDDMLNEVTIVIDADGTICMLLPREDGYPLVLECASPDDDSAPRE